MNVYCPSCGHRNPRGSSFCASCGSALVEESSEATIAIVPVEGVGDDQGDLRDDDLGKDGSEYAMLVVRRGPNAGARYRLEKDVVKLGRHPESEIFLDDITVSRRHAEVRKEGSGLHVVRDVGSLNGTYVNRERVDEAVLDSGDELQIGKFRLVYISSVVNEEGE